MRKPAILAILVVLTLALAYRPAEAACRLNCPTWLDAIGYTIAVGVIGGYAAGTGYFIYRDLHDDEQTLKYAGAEVGVNGVLALLFGAATVDAIKHGKAGSTTGLASLAILHGTLAAHGTWRAYQYRDEFNPPDNTLAWVSGIAYSTNTILWTTQLSSRHGRNYGIAEAAVNAPIALGLGYLAFDRARDRSAGAAVLFGGMAVLSGAFVYHGLRTAISPPQSPGLDLLGTDLMPTVVTDGHEIAPGIGASGTW